MVKSRFSDIKAKNGRATMKTPYSTFKDAAKENAKAKHSSSGVQIRLGVMAFGILLACIFYLFPDLLSTINPNSSGKV